MACARFRWGIGASVTLSKARIARPVVAKGITGQASNVVLKRQRLSAINDLTGDISVVRSMATSIVKSTTVPPAELVQNGHIAPVGTSWRYTNTPKRSSPAGASYCPASGGTITPGSHLLHESGADQPHVQISRGPS